MREPESSASSRSIYEAVPDFRAPIFFSVGEGFRLGEVLGRGGRIYWKGRKTLRCKGQRFMELSIQVKDCGGRVTMGTTISGGSMYNALALVLGRRCTSAMC